MIFVNHGVSEGIAIMRNLSQFQINFGQISYIEIATLEYMHTYSPLIWFK